MATITGETAFIEISKFLNRQLKIFKNKEDDKPKENGTE
jgi:hypothetical protein